MTIVNFDYNADYDDSQEHNGLENSYQITDERSPNTGSRLGSRISGTTHDYVQVQHSPAGESGSSSKTSNTLFNLPNNLGGTEQEAYFEVDVRLGPDYTLGGDDTDRWLWVLNHEGDNAYDSTSGNGFSAAMGTTPRGNPPEGYLTFFSYTYDSRGGGNFQAEGIVPEDEWFTLQGYFRCNDIGSSNAEYRFWCNEELLQERTGFQTSNAQDAWIGDLGFTGYYIDYGGNAVSNDRYRHFDNHQIWTGSDIPSSRPRSVTEPSDPSGDEPVPQHGDNYYLHPTSGHQSNSLIVDTSVYVERGRTYTSDIWIQNGEPTSLGIAFGAQNSSWNLYTGYLYHMGENETRLQRWNNGELQTEATGNAVPTGRKLGLEIQYENPIRVLVVDIENSETTNDVSLQDSQIDSGYPGFYHYRDTNAAIYNFEDTGSPSDPGDGGGEVPIEGELDPEDREIGAVWFREDLA